MLWMVGVLTLLIFLKIICQFLTSFARLLYVFCERTTYCIGKFVIYRDILHRSLVLDIIIVIIRQLIVGSRDHSSLGFSVGCKRKQ